MSLTSTTQKFNVFRATAVGALALAAVAVPMSPAKAFIGVDLGGVAIGVDGPVYYYPPPVFNYYDNYYGPNGYYIGPGPSGYYSYGW